MSTEEINKEFIDVVNKWRMADSQRMIFGVDMPQTQRAIADLSQSLQRVLDSFQAISLVEKAQKMEIIVKNTAAQDASALTGIPVNLPILPGIFRNLRINSITLRAGITASELTEFFRGIGMRPEDLERQGGLKGLLQGRGVTNIKVDQMKFQLLNEEEQTVASKEVVDRILAGSKRDGKSASGGAVKQQSAIWKEFLSGKLSAEDFKDRHKDFLHAVEKNPKQLEKILKRLATKQKNMETYLVQLEQKLTEVGLYAETIETLKKKLFVPKKILVPEDELARLRIIEKEYQQSAGAGMDAALKTIKSIQKKLTEEIARSEAILHQMGQGGIVLDRRGNVLSANATAQNVLGLSEGEIRGKKIQDILKPHHLLTAVSDWQDESDTHTPKEVRVYASDEETLAIIRESTVVIQNEDGRSIGVVSALHSVTQQEELTRRKNDILDVLGHDLRAPLGAIKQNFDVLVASAKLQEDGSDQQKKFVDNCKNNLVRMGKLIEKIMDMRQLETGKIMLKFDIVKINQLLEDAVHSLGEWAQNKSIKLEMAASAMPDIEGDPERLYQVITNLVSNALKFTPEGGSILVRGQPVQDKAGECVEVVVQDSGMGIRQEDLTRIFDKYEQVTANAPAGVSGLGLGLSICRTIIQLHGGTIWAESELRKGSMFTFRVPIKQHDSG